MHYITLHWRAIMGVGAAIISVLLHMAGIKWPLLLLLWGALAVLLPYPAIFRSWVARGVISLFVLHAFVQLATIVQFYIFPNSGFTTLGAIALAGIAAVIAARFFVGSIHIQKSPLCTTQDAAAFFIGLCFALPFGLLISLGPNSLVSFGGIQSTDGVNHFMALDEMAKSQRLTYRTTEYYPKTFHLATAFFQDTVNLSAHKLSWNQNAKMYMAQYIVAGLLLAYVIFYTASYLFTLFMPKISRGHSWALASVLAPVATLLFLLPFAYQGFLNYYYIVATCLLALVCLDAAYRSSGQRPWLFAGYYLLVSGASFSWPLLVPIFLAIPLAYELLAAGSLRGAFAAWRTRHGLLLDAGSVLQIIPIYMHIRYSSLTTEQGLNAEGALRDFHHLIFIAGLAGLVYSIFALKRGAVWAKLITAWLAPFYAFIGAFIVYQLFTAGELRYYVIKTTFLLEIILLCIGAVALLAFCLARLPHKLGATLLAATTLPLTVMLLIAATGVNPLQDVRQMFRQASGFGFPAFFTQDIQKFTHLGQHNLIYNSNNAVLHYDAQKDMLYGNMTIQVWANIMQPSSPKYAEIAGCSGKIHPIAMYQEFSPTQQAALIAAVRECAQLAASYNVPYYIVSDAASAPHIEAIFGPKVIVF